MTGTHASVENFDLGRHAVVEASAGTGKTYTIENLVLRLLREENVSLDQILIVTFTEKATGELKIRVRKTLERALQQDPEDAPILKPAVDHFDQAAVFTIHGFCQRLMQEYALEQGQDFQSDLVYDPELLESLLREVQRKDWRREFGPNLRSVLERAGYSGNGATKWDRRVLEIAKRFKPRCGHRLLPEYRDGWWKQLDDLDANPVGQLETFTINALHRHLRDAKRQRGQHSFDDMIAAVEENLDPERNDHAASLLVDLRKRFRYGIVDEFQDTDPLQWRIFRRIFCEGGASRLFIVGDPKQAIFAFRGADLPTYLRAAREMSDEFRASEYPLDVNWRSEPNLLEALNGVFGDGGWFPEASGIKYVHVDWPDDNQRQARMDDDQTGRSPLSIVDVTHIAKIKQAQKYFARFCAYEIHRLLGGQGRRSLLTLSLKKGEPRTLDANDICILIRKRAEAEWITQFLDDAGIPFSFYKQTGLWSSDEATHLRVLLQALARPEDHSSFRKALLTCFFRVAPADLASAPDVPMQHPARQLWQTWLGCVEHRQWSALFRSLLEDTGLLIPSPEDHRADRRLANLRPMLAAFEQAGHGLNLDLLGLLEWMRRKERDANETEMQPDEAGRPKVKIMTIHASKGLEFPIVFLAGGFTQGQNDSGVKVFHDDQQNLVFSLGDDEEGAARMNAEADAEERRLFYVALTRPIFKLYVPMVKVTRRGPWLGPVATILLPALERSCPDKFGSLVAEVVLPPMNLTVEKTAPTSPETSLPGATIALPGSLFPAIDHQIGKRRVVVRSFSSLARHHLSSDVVASFGEHAPAVSDETPTPLDQDDPLRGPVFGDMVHNVLEHIDFAEVRRAASPEPLWQAGTHARKCIDREVRANIAKLSTRTPLEQLEAGCRQQIAILVWHALTTPLAEVGKLCAIPKSDRLHEVDFLFPDQPSHPKSAGARPEESFVTGFMDLLFRKGDDYYLLDWKTNLLPAYTPEQLERSMADSDYHRQYGLYLHAARRWLLRVHGPAFPFYKRFRGVYYLYVRGMNGRDETSGVYYHRPSEAELELANLLNS